MKKIILIGIAALTVSYMAVAQEQGNGQQKKVEKAKNEVKEEAKNIKRKQKNEENGKTGNAHGKNKGDLSGKEFGQQRSAEARSAAQMKKEEAGKKIIVQEKQIEENEIKIKKAKEKVQKEEEGRKITSEEAKIKKEKIAKAEEKNKQMKDIVEKEKTELAELNNILQK